MKKVYLYLVLLPVFDPSIFLGSIVRRFFWRFCLSCPGAPSLYSEAAPVRPWDEGPPREAMVLRDEASGRRRPMAKK